MPHQQKVAFSLVEGSVIYQSKYYNTVRSRPVFSNYVANPDPEPIFAPNNTGSHMSVPEITLRESLSGLILSCSIESARQERKVDLLDTIQGFMSLRWGKRCSHATTSELPEGTRSRKLPLCATTVLRPWAGDGHLPVAMTRDRPEAQFWCCMYEKVESLILQKGCCLDCVVQQLPARTSGALIIAG